MDSHILVGAFDDLDEDKAWNKNMDIQFYECSEVDPEFTIHQDSDTHHDNDWEADIDKKDPRE